MSERREVDGLYAALLDAPDDKIAEIIDGSLWLSPRPAIRHANAASSLTSQLHDAFQRGRSGPGGWWILFEPELHLEGNVLVPDVAGWRHETSNNLPDAPWMDLAPDWVCEVLSASSIDMDRRKKAAVYAFNRVSHYWIVDPAERRLEVLVREGAGWRLVSVHHGDAIVSAPPFEAAPVELSALWL